MTDLNNQNLDTNQADIGMAEKAIQDNLQIFEAAQQINQNMTPNLKLETLLRNQPETALWAWDVYRDEKNYDAEPVYEFKDETFDYLFDEGRYSTAGGIFNSLRLGKVDWQHKYFKFADDGTVVTFATLTEQSSPIDYKALAEFIFERAEQEKTEKGTDILAFSSFVAGDVIAMINQ